ncbi:hypothetical protein DPX16_3664 [Anabarilius grahami]|uniref:Uncharacterized protein n=1 Tax=Anabarilius grahami TaxID=495550 RepID=A0A3N0Z5G7_ANAGA|nr:hypothetical protein DPX16_3664 [Anabarilius grahami]
MEDRRDRHFEMMLEGAREARRHEAEITRQHIELQSGLARHTQSAGAGVEQLP